MTRDSTPFDWVHGRRIQDITTALARRMVKVANAVARGAVDEHVTEEARRISSELRVRQGKRLRELRARAADRKAA